MCNIDSFSIVVKKQQNNKIKRAFIIIDTAKSTLKTLIPLSNLQNNISHHDALKVRLLCRLDAAPYRGSRSSHPRRVENNKRETWRGRALRLQSLLSSVDSGVLMLLQLLVNKHQRPSLCLGTSETLAKEKKRKNINATSRITFKKRGGQGGRKW